MVGIEARRRECKRCLPARQRSERDQLLSLFSLSLKTARQSKAKAARRRRLTFVQWPRVDDDDAELFPLPLGLEEDPFDDARPRIGQDDVAVLDLFDRVLLNHAAGEEDPVPDERVNLGQQDLFRLRFLVRSPGQN